MQNSVFSITKCPRKFEARKVFEVTLYKPNGVSNIEKSNSGQETSEQFVGDSQAEIRLFGKRKNSQQIKCSQQSLLQLKDNPKKTKADSSPKEAKLKNSLKTLKTLMSSFENTFYNQACNILRSRINHEINNELNKSREKVSGQEHLERLGSTVKKMMEKEMEGEMGKDMVGQYLEIQSEVIKSVSFNEFRRLMSDMMYSSNS